MRRFLVIASVLLGLFSAMNAFGQDASLGGTVADATGAVIPGAEVTEHGELERVALVRQIDGGTVLAGSLR